MAEIVAFAGQSFRATWDETTWPDYVAINKQWKRWPPPAISLAVLAKLTPKSDEPEDETDQSAGVAELAQLIGSPPPG